MVALEQDRGAPLCLCPAELQMDRQQGDRSGVKFVSWRSAQGRRKSSLSLHWKIRAQEPQRSLTGPKPMAPRYLRLTLLPFLICAS